MGRRIGRTQRQPASCIEARHALDSRRDNFRDLLSETCCQRPAVRDLLSETVACLSMARQWNARRRPDQKQRTCRSSGRWNASAHVGSRPGAPFRRATFGVFTSIPHRAQMDEPGSYSVQSTAVELAIALASYLAAPNALPGKPAPPEPSLGPVIGQEAKNRDGAQEGDQEVPFFFSLGARLPCVCLCLCLGGLAWPSSWTKKVPR